MKRTRKKLKRGLTLVEIMVAAIVALIIVIGFMSFQYATALNARRGDARAIASRLGLLVLEGWKSAGVDLTIFNPTDDQFDQYLPDELTTTSVGLGGTGAELGRYTITVNGINYYMTLLYPAGYVYPPAPATPPPMLTVLTAWNRDDFMSGELGDNPQRIRLTGYAIY